MIKTNACRSAPVYVLVVHIFIAIPLGVARACACPGLPMATSLQVDDIYLFVLEYDSDASSTTSGYSPSLDSFEDFEPDQGSLSFNDLLDSIMDAIKVYHSDSIKILKSKVIIMLNSNSQGHSVPPRYIEKLSRYNCNNTDGIFEYFSRYIKKESPAVLRIIVDASDCKKARDLFENYFG